MNEIRSVPSNLKIIKRDDGTSTRSIQGYAIMFDTLSVDLGGFTEVIKPTALDGVDLSDIALVYAHENNSILARASAGNLKTQLDSTGLFFSAELPDTSLANDVLANIEVGNIKGMSFTFTIPDGGDTWNRQADGTLLHTVNQIGTITELTVTAYPAYQQTSVELKRSAENIIQKGTSNLAEENIKPDEATKESDNKDVVNSEPAKEPAKRDETPEVPDVDIANLVTQIAQLQSAISTLQAEANNSEDEDTEASDESDEEVRDDDTDLERDEGDEDLERSAENTNTEEQKRSIENTKDNLENMAQVVKNTQTNERSNFHNFLKRDISSITDGTVASDNSVALPKDILKPIEKPANTNSLIALANIQSVNAPSGDIPVLGATNVTLNTTAELQANPQLAKMQLETVSYKLSVKRGFLPVSQELLDHADTAVGIDSLIGDYASQIRDNTLVAGIASVLKQADKVTAKSFDDVKVAYNGLFKYNNKSFVATKSAFDLLDTLKDSQGRYLLTDSISSPSGKQVLGAPVYVVEDTVLGAKDGDAVMFVGDVKSFGIFPTYKDLRVKWTDSDIYGQKLQLVLENDNVVAQKEAGKLVALNFTAPATAGTQG